MKQRGTYAMVTLDDNGHLTDDSALSIVTKGDTVEIVVMGAPIPARTEAGDLALGRVCAALEEHGYRTVDCYCAERKVEGGIEFDVERASAAERHPNHGPSRLKSDLWRDGHDVPHDQICGFLAGM